MLPSFEVVPSSPWSLFGKEGPGEIFFFYPIPLSQWIADLLEAPDTDNKLCRMIRLIDAIPQGSRSSNIPATTSATPPSMRALSCSANRK